MTVIIPCLLLAVFWLVVHGLHRLVASRFLTPLLPRTRLAHPSPPLSWVESDHTSFSLSYVNLKLETSIFNAAHQRLSANLAKHGWIPLGRAIYGIGGIIGVVGMFASVCLVAWTGLVVVYEYFSTTPTSGPTFQLEHQVVRRALGDLAASLAPTSKANLALRPLIPGVTIPISHLPLLLAALFLCQSLHELGHAVAAAIEDTTLHSVGLALFVIMPTAFVSLNYNPSTSPSSKIRLASAGALHNILIWIVFYAAAHSGLSQIATPIGWTDVGNLGKVVLGFNGETTLDDYIPRGALVTQLNDTPLGMSHTNNTKEDPWELFLLSKAPTEQQRGWCIDSSEFVSYSTACCSEPSTPELACFVAMSGGASEYQGHCISPLSLFNRNNTTPRRCETAACPGEQVCIHPSPEAQLLRITFVDMDRGKERVVVWKGPRLEVWRQVRVGTYLPRTSLIPFWLPDLIDLFISYNLTVTIALYLFNLLPLPYLDGGQVLSSVLEITTASASARGDAGEDGVGRTMAGRLWRERVEKGVHWSVGILCAVVTLAVLVKELMRS